ncbi:MAG: signal recognition particle-docking protein FtsY [Actinobacteria bacterium]|nr:signal recognition particle-docking protein FtsY [Actinomycetota bacterium]
MAGKGKKKHPKGKPKKRRAKPLREETREQAAGEEVRPKEELEPAPLSEPLPGETEAIELEGPVDGSVGAEAEPPEEEGEEWGRRLRRGMSRSRRAITMPFTRAAARKAITPEFWTEAEDALIAADAGVACSARIVENAKKRIISEGIRDIEGLKDAFRREVVAMLESFGEPPEPPPERPRVIFIAGVNGVGKTTTAAKIGFLLKEKGNKILFAAADTFRAAGIEQMEMWASRVVAPVVSHQAGGDPAAVVYDSIESAKAKSIDTVLVDTAGRLHTKKNLMEELGKMWRVADRQLPGRPEAILVIDATTGQNGVSQARIFGEVLDVSSIALTKMDGSAKGGVVMAIGMELGIPVAYIGVGEGISDLKPFDPEQYATALF